MALKEAYNTEGKTLREILEILGKIFEENSTIPLKIDNQLGIAVSKITVNFIDNLQDELITLKKFIHALELLQLNTDIEKEMLSELDSFLEKNSGLFKKLESEINKGLIENAKLTMASFPSMRDIQNVLDLLPELRERINTRTLDFLATIRTSDPDRFKSLYNVFTEEF